MFHPYRDIDKPGVRFLRSAIRSIDPAAKRVHTDDGAYDADVLAVALGADLDPSATPGLVEGGDEFYTVAGAFARRDVIADFPGGRVRSASRRPVQMGVPIPPSPDASKALLTSFA